MKSAAVIRIGLLGLIGAAFSPDAHAITCKDIMNMVNVNVPENIVVQTIEDSGDEFTEADISCLQSNGAPASVVAAARRRIKTVESTAPAPTSPTPAQPGDDWEEDDGLGGDRDYGSSTAPRELTDGGEDESRGPAAVEDAIELYRAKKLLTASKAFYDLIESGTYPSEEPKLKYYLGRCLYDLKMYHTAQYYFLDVLRLGPSSPYFKYVLPKLVATAQYTGDNTDLLKIVPKIPPDQYPRQAQSHLYYLMGVRLYEQDKLADAQRYLGQISTKSDLLYLKAKYYEGVINNKQGLLKSAVRAFRDVMHDSEVVDAYSQREADEIARLRDLSIVNVARIYYGIQRFDEATTWYNIVPHESDVWPQALFESAWANFMQNDLNLALGQILTIRSPFYNNTYFAPEATVLRALTFFNLCEYDQVERELLTFEDEIRPIYAELKEFTERYRSSEGRKLADQAYEEYFEGSPANSVLPKAMFNTFLQNQSLAGLVRHLDIMAQEEELIAAQKSAWQGSVGSHLDQVLQEDRQTYKRRAGLLLLSEMASMANYLEDLLAQSEIIRFEVVSAQRADYSYKMANPDLLDLSGEMNIDFATAVDFIYWPFNGEFWKDELGYYHYTEQGSCQ